MMTTQRYRGTCDASAATWIAGTTLFVAACDEDFVLRVYDAAQPGFPLGELDVTTFLEPVNAKKEPDIEGAAAVGNRVYWIASHGRDKDAVEQESRQRLFATEVSVVNGHPRVQPVGRPYKKLLADLTSAPELAGLDLATAATRAPEAAGGLNIEGMSSTPDGRLLVGFRNPIPQGRALIARIENAADVVAGTSAARITLGALLDLGGRGVRAIETSGDGKYYILAGSFNDDRNFALFVWDGRSPAPTLVLDGTTLNDLNPEELLIVPDPVGGSAVQLFSDDGDALVDGKKCKKLDPEARSFRVASVQLTA